MDISFNIFGSMGVRFDNRLYSGRTCSHFDSRRASRNNIQVDFGPASDMIRSVSNKEHVWKY